VEKLLKELMVRRSRGNIGAGGTWRQHIACGMRPPSRQLMRIFNEEADRVPAVELVLQSSKIFASVVLVIDRSRGADAAINIWINRVNTRLKGMTTEELEELSTASLDPKVEAMAGGSEDSLAWKGRFSSDD